MTILQRIYTPIRAGAKFHYSYFKQIVRWAVIETIKHIGLNRPTLIVSVLTFIFTVVFRAKTEGVSAMLDALGNEFLYVVSALVVVGVVVFLVNLLRGPAKLYSLVEHQRDDLDANLRKINDKQKEVDNLSSLLSKGINHIWNRPVSDQSQLNELKTYWEDWQHKVEAALGAPFTESDRIHFRRLGVVPIVGRDGTFPDPTGVHKKILREYALKEARLREVIRDHNITHIYLQYDPTISTTRNK